MAQINSENFTKKSNLPFLSQFFAYNQTLWVIFNAYVEKYMCSILEIQSNVLKFRCLQDILEEGGTATVPADVTVEEDDETLEEDAFEDGYVDKG